MYLFLGVIILGFIFFVLKNGNISFWKKASKNPDIAYEILKEDSAWAVDYENNPDKKLFDGPFLLFVPKLNRNIKFYGKRGEYEESQKKIESIL